MGFLEAHLAASPSGWLAGTPGPSIADFCWAPALTAVGSGWTGNAEALNGFAKVQAFLERFMGLPEVKAYYGKA